jgi:hypothetical protein
LRSRSRPEQSSGHRLWRCTAATTDVRETLSSLRRSIGTPLSSQALRRPGPTPLEREGEQVTVQQVIEAHPQPTSLDRDALLRCIDACFDCAATCTSCADACLAEQDVQELVRCIRLNHDCADACTLRAASSLARPRPMSACSAQRFKPVPRPVAHMARSVSGTPSTTSTAASAPEPAAAANRHATTYSRRSVNHAPRQPLDVIRRLYRL